MAKTDPQATRKRLAEHYASITNEELVQLADNAWSLTDIAKDALKAELSRRQLSVELHESAPAQDTRPNLVVLRTFRDLPEALVAKSILDSGGIESFLQDDNVVRMDWLWSNAIGNIKLLVKAEAVADAVTMLDQKPIERFDVTGSGEYKQPRCPACGSVDASYGATGRRLAYATVALGIPLPVKRGGWKCNSCGDEWNEPADDAPERDPDS